MDWQDYPSNHLQHPWTYRQRNKTFQRIRVFFKRIALEKCPITAPPLERYYHIDGNQFERQYKEHLNNYRTWSQLSHAEERLLFPENREPYLSIDRTPISNGELYTIIIYREADGGIRSIVAIVKETKTMSSLLWDKSPRKNFRRSRR